ncbi:disease resistance protein RUN1-like [Vitis riparia]|uniref:disease resistance protein RUN1-like n=1 Tax=Vitis riparia TaxID=96939 RepID=UPI00155B0BAA|nr:disease resistance protein RUN1-like [Vitis riparia]
MASTSSRKPSSFSTSIPPSSYDAFLSFRGEDTRKNFTGHLYRALVTNGINTFKDDEELETGGVIAEALIQAIEESKVFYVIFSKNYAYSKWCLNELVKIIECMKAKQRRVVPIFYDVDPSEVRRQSGGYGKAFAYHQKDANQEKKKEIQKWRMALTEAGNLAGYDLRNYRYESKVIENIIDDILKTSHQLLHVEDNIIGMNLRLEKLKSLIEVESNDVRMVGIYGFGGIGKTTMSKAIYNEISTKFEGISFLENVRENFKVDCGLVRLQQQLINSILKRKNPTISTSHEGIQVIKERLQTKKVLVVLDDVDESKQLEYLAGKHDWFGPGSRIIITSRDRHLLNVHGVDALHEVKELNQKEATQLFSQHAFKKDLPEEHYVELSKRVVDYTGGVPLALKVLGSFLFRKEIREWESELCKLKRKPNKDVQNVLRTSFDGLDDFEKELFLDIACFFKGQNENFVTRILDSCGFNATIGIKVLSDKCLITFFHGTIGMHDLLQEMGREIVREEYPRDLGKWTRLWEPDDVYRVLRREMGTKAIEGIFLDMATSKEIQFTNEAFKQMNNLRLFKVYRSSHHYGVTKRDYKVLLPKNFEFPSYELRYLYWDRYPLKFLPSHFDGENLVELNLQSSNIKKFGKGISVCKL